MKIDKYLLEQELESLESREKELLQGLEELKALRVPLMREMYIRYITELMERNNLKELPIRKFKVTSGFEHKVYANSISIENGVVSFDYYDGSVPLEKADYNELEASYNLLLKYVFVQNVAFHFNMEDDKCTVHVIYTDDEGCVDMGVFGALLDISTIEDHLVTLSEVFRKVRPNKKIK